MSQFSVNTIHHPAYPLCEIPPMPSWMSQGWRSRMASVFFCCQLSNADHSNMVQYYQDYCKDNFNMITIVHLITSLLLLLHIGVKGRKKRKKNRRFFSDLLPQNRERCWKSSWRDFLDLKERQGEMFIQALLIMSSSTWFP